MTATWVAVAVGSAARRTVRDPAGLAVAVGFYAIVASVIATLWRIAAAGHGGMVAGYTPTQLTWYLYFAEASVTALNARQIELTGDDIAGGSIAVEMLRPVSVVGMRLATEIGRALPRLTACAAIGFALAWMTGGAPVDGLALALSIPALMLAVGCNLAGQHAFAGAAFWIRDARSTWFLYQKLVFLLGAMLIPVEALPGPMHAVADGLPFLAMAYVPARLASGHVQPQLLALQAGWLVVLLGAAVAVFGAGQRRLQAVGG